MKTTNIVVKVASRCNLNCTYCYMYNMGDDSYKLQPKYMKNGIVKAMLNKIKNHCKKHKLEKFLVIFHGGEPILIGKKFYEDFVSFAKEILPSSICIEYSMQTNGVLLDEEWCKFLDKLGIQVGVSLDGTPSSNNLNRIYHNGKGSYDDIVKGFKNIKSVFGYEYAHCLCVIDTKESPEDVYLHFKELGTHTVSFLFQDYNYIETNINDVPEIGGWLIKLFDVWYNDKDDMKPMIKPFKELMGLILGNTSGSESFGKGFNDTIVVETNGSIETVDTLRICGNGFTRTKLNVLDNEFDDLFKESELSRLYYNAHNLLCEKCENCELEKVCGGGYLGHRYSKDNGFDNPSIYCNEITKIICYIQNVIIQNLPEDLVDKLGIKALNVEEILKKNNKYAEV